MTPVSKQEDGSESNRGQCRVSEHGLSVLIKKVYNRYQFCGIHKVTVTETMKVDKFKDDHITDFHERLHFIIP